MLNEYLYAQKNGTNGSFFNGKCLIIQWRLETKKKSLFCCV